MKITDELLDRFLDGDISEDEGRGVLAWLEIDADNMARFAGRAELHADLRRSLRRRSIQSEAVATIEHFPAGSRPEPFADRRTARRRSLALALAVAALTAAATLAFVLFRMDDVPPAQNAPPPIAALAYHSNAHWADYQRASGDAIGVGVLQLEVGIARLDFTNGAVVTLQGPAKFEVVDANRARLHHGILTAHVPEPAVGFEVETPALEVVDLGTTFGVSVGSDGETDVCVFEGEVAVSVTDVDKPPTARRVAEGAAVRTRPRASAIEEVGYHTGRFEDSWPVTSGVLQTTGLMRFVSPGPDFAPGRYEDSEHILVFPERRDVVLAAAVAVDLVAPGQYQRIHRREGNSVEPGRRVRSYLVQLDPVGRLQRKPSNRARVMGQITFDRPIIGLIGSTSKLAATDRLLGHPRGNYGNATRGIEPPEYVELPDVGRDLVVLSRDRRTLSLDLSAGSAVDQIRVLVSESDIVRTLGR